MILVLMTIGISFSFISSTAQERAKDIPLKLSDADKRAVIACFNNVDDKYHRMLFNAGKEVYGTRTIASTEMERIRNARLQEKGIIIICKETNSMIIYLRDGSIILASSGRAGTNPFLNLLGKEKTEKLKLIMAKYVDNADLLGAPDT